VALTTHPQLAPRLKKEKSSTSAVSLWALVACPRVNFTLCFVYSTCKHLRRHLRDVYRLPHYATGFDHTSSDIREIRGFHSGACMKNSATSGLMTCSLVQFYQYFGAVYHILVRGGNLKMEAVYSPENIDIFLLDCTASHPRSQHSSQSLHWNLKNRMFYHVRKCGALCGLCIAFVYRIDLGTHQICVVFLI